MSRRGSGPRLRWRKGQWSIMWTEDGRTRERRTGATGRPEAEEIFTNWLSERRERPQGLRRASEYLIADCLAEYLEEKATQSKSAVRAAYAVDKLLDYFGSMAIDAINETTCRGYVRQRKAAVNTIRRELTVLRAAVNYATKAGRVPAAPVLWLPAPDPGKDRWLTRDEAARLLWEARRDRDARAYMPLFILLGLYGGARKSAILGLRWPQVNFDRGTLDWNDPTQTKTKKGRSKIPIPRRLMTFLKLARKRGSDLGYVVNIRGQRIKDVKKGFAGAAIRAGFYVTATDRNGKTVKRATISPHVLRHTCGTWLAHHGTPLFDVGGWLGHTMDRTTELYAHHHPDHLARAAAAFDRHSVANTVAKPKKSDGNI